LSRRRRRVDQLVERAADVEHHRPQRHRPVDPGGAKQLLGDAALVVVERRQAERRGQAARRVDRQDQRTPAGARARQPQRRRGRGLADAARSDAHDNPALAHEVGDRGFAPHSQRLR
jgi:hypothetical protein